MPPKKQKKKEEKPSGKIENMYEKIPKHLLEKAENVIIKPYLDKRSSRPMQTVDSARKKARKSNSKFRSKNIQISFYLSFHTEKRFFQ